METTTYIALSRQTALERQMSIVANNLANMNTAGYQSQSALFVEYLAGESGDEEQAMVRDLGIHRDVSAGPLQQTGSSLDVALNGAGYFQVEGPNGNTAYTRSGQFRLNDAGELTTPAGHRVLDTGGQPIALPEGFVDLLIDESGRITADGAEVARLEAVTFENQDDLDAVGNGLLTTDADPIPSPETQMRQGFVEGSNVQPIVELTRMIDVQRAYEATANMLTQEHDRQSDVINRLGRPGN